MNTTQLLILVASLLPLWLSGVYGPTLSTQLKEPVVRLAELEIHPSHLTNYQAALKEEIEASIRLEPGVLTLYAVAEKDNPTHIRMFEMYADTNAYDAHRESPHFLKYKAATKDMVRSLKLIETTPVMLGAKTK